MPIARFEAHQLFGVKARPDPAAAGPQCPVASRGQSLDGIEGVSVEGLGSREVKPTNRTPTMET